MTSPLPALAVVPDLYAVCKFDAGASVPAWAIAGSFYSITRTAEELSIVCGQDAVPDGVLSERGWRCLRVAGTMPFSAIGILVSLTAPLAEAGISVFAISTFDTDYLLVKEKDLAATVDVLRQRGSVISL